MIDHFGIDGIPRTRSGQRVLLRYDPTRELDGALRTLAVQHHALTVAFLQVTEAFRSFAEARARW